LARSVGDEGPPANKLTAVVSAVRGVSPPMNAKHPPGAPMTLGNMRHLGVQDLVATGLNDACRHQGLVDVSTCPPTPRCCGSPAGHRDRSSQRDASGCEHLVSVQSS